MPQANVTTRYAICHGMSQYMGARLGESFPFSFSFIPSSRVSLG
jgi:hypothetical protein